MIKTANSIANRTIRSAIIVVTLVAISATALYGCGGEAAPTATPAPPPPPTATLPPPSPTLEPPTPTTAAAQPTDTVAPAAAGAGSGSTGSTSTQPNDPAAIALMKKSSAAMKGLKSVHMTIESPGAANPFTAEGDLELPDKMRMTADTAQGKVEEIIVGNNMYMKMPGSDAYLALPSNPAVVRTIASLRGMDVYIQNAQGATIVGSEQVGGADTTHIKFSYDQDKVTAAFDQALGLPTPVPNTGPPNMATGEMWIDKSNYYLRQHKYDLGSGALVQGKIQVIMSTLSKFNEPVSPPIEKPTNVQQLPGQPGQATPTP